MIKIQFIILDDARKLLELVLNDADLIKLAAYRQLKTLYKEVTIYYYFVIYIIVVSIKI